MNQLEIFVALIAAFGLVTPAKAQDTARNKTVLIAKGAEWSYYTLAGEPSGNWKHGEEAAGWLAGRTSIGYDKGDVVTVFPAFAEASASRKGGVQHGGHTHSEAGSQVAEKYPAIYYRRTFNWEPALATDGKQAVISLRCDDACVVLVNGKEAVRAHLPAGPVKFYATEGIMKSVFYPFAISPDLLLPGQNHIAVVVYNSSTDDHDHAFNAELSVDVPPAYEGTPRIQLKTK